MRIPALLTILLLCLCAAGQQPAGLEGVVVNSATGEPLGRVQVHLTTRAPDAGPPPPGYGAVTDDAGRFSVSPIPPGTYMVLPQRFGYYLTLSREKTAAIPTVALKPGQQVRDYRLEMSPRAVVSGRVLDENGDPVRRADIRLESVSASNALLYFLGIYKDSTNDRGEYRISLPAGTYRIRAEIPEYDDDEIRTDGSMPMTYPPTWHPNVTSPEDAGPVEARSGAETTGADIRLRPVRLSIGGRVTGIPAGATASVRFICIHRGGSSFDDIAPKPDGSFSFGRLEPGVCSLFAYSSSGGRELRSAVAQLDLKEDPVTELELALKPGSDVSGTLEMADKEEAANRVVRLESLDQVMGKLHTGRVSRDGIFDIKDVGPDRYRVAVGPLPEDGYVKTVLLDGAPVQRGILDLRAGASTFSLKIATGKGAARISGKVEDASGRPAPTAMVFIFPEGAESSEETRYSQTSSDGAYSFRDIAPGKYRLYAREPTGSITLAEARARAEAVELKEGDRITRSLKLLTKETVDGKKQ